jgi:hypothetical protein
MDDAVDDREIINRLTEIAAAMERRPHVRDWVDAHHAGDVLGTDEAGFICGCSADTIRRRADAAAEEGRPLGIRHAGIWMLDLPRLLDWTEQHYGRHARLVAESRARKNAETRVSLQNRPLAASGAAVAAR